MTASSTSVWPAAVEWGSPLVGPGISSEAAAGAAGDGRTQPSAAGLVGVWLLGTAGRPPGGPVPPSHATTANAMTINAGTATMRVFMCIKSRCGGAGFRPTRR